jgi:hypothetical protein
MLKPGILIGELLEPGSMAQAIEQAMIDQGLLVLDEESPDAAELRRKTFIAIATGVIGHLTAQLEIVVASDKFAPNVPAVQTLLQGAAGELR